jgi:hypothetical protein
MLADARAPAVLAGATLAVVELCSQMLALPAALAGPLAVMRESQMLGPCIGSGGGCARRCWRPRSPCRCSCGDYARRCWRPRSPCIGYSRGYAGRCRRPRSPCRCSSGSCARTSCAPSVVRSAAASASPFPPRSPPSPPPLPPPAPPRCHPRGVHLQGQRGGPAPGSSLGLCHPHVTGTLVHQGPGREPGDCLSTFSLSLPPAAFRQGRTRKKTIFVKVISGEMQQPALIPLPRRERDIGAQQVPPREDAFVPKFTQL